MGKNVHKVTHMHIIRYTTQNFTQVESRPSRIAPIKFHTRSIAPRQYGTLINSLFFSVVNSCDAPTADFDKNIGGHYYYKSTSTFTFEDAQEDCHRRDSQLVVADNEFDMAAIINLMSN